MRFTTILIAFALTFSTQAFGQYGAPAGKAGGVPGMPAMGGVPDIPQTELSDETAKGAIDAYLAIKEKYGDDTPQPNTRGGNAATAFSALDGVNAITNNFGFSDTGEWHKTLISVAMAYGFSKDSKTGADVDASLAKIKDNPQIPASLKEQMMAMITKMRPSENNLGVVQSLLASPDYKTKLETIGK